MAPWSPLTSIKPLMYNSFVHEQFSPLIIYKHWSWFEPLTPLMTSKITTTQPLLTPLVSDFWLLSLVHHQQCARRFPPGMRPPEIAGVTLPGEDPGTPGWKTVGDGQLMVILQYFFANWIANWWLFSGQLRIILMVNWWLINGKLMVNHGLFHGNLMVNWWLTSPGPLRTIIMNQPWYPYEPLRITITKRLE